MLIVDKLDGWVDVALCEPADETTPMQRAEDCSWFKVPSDRQLDKLLTSVPAECWANAALTRREEVTETRPWLMATPKDVERGAGRGGPDGLEPGRRDRGARRSRAREPQIVDHDRRPQTSSGSPASTPQAPRRTSLGVANPPPVCLPAGLMDWLPPYAFEAFRAAAVDIIDRLSRGERERYRGMRCKDSRKRYGQVRLRYTVGGEQVSDRPWVWDEVRLHLEWLGVFEYRKAADGQPYFRKGTKSMSYRLTRRWREVVSLERFERPSALWVPPLPKADPKRRDGTSITVPAWYEQSLDRVRFDLRGALRHLCEAFGAVEPSTLDFDDYRDAFAEARPSAEMLEAIKTKMRRGDKREPIDVARAKALARLAHIWRWRVDGVSWCHRDAAGWRLHSPLTALAGELRRFVSFDGVDEELISIDAANSQMVILAAMVHRDLPDAPDAKEFLEICAAGTFYEGAFMAAYGTEPTKLERNAFKREVMGCWLYSERHKQGVTAVGKALAEAWPAVHAWFLDHKLTASTLPCEAQRREATIWVDRLADELQVLGVPAVSVHDSVLVPRSRGDKVLAVLERLYAEAGLRAAFRVEAV